jgi:hypothetical protein
MSDVKTFSAAAASYVKRTLSVELDGSEESLAYVDHYVATTSRGTPVSGEVMNLIAPAFGAYFGDVLIGKFGGKWVCEGEPADWQLELEPVPLRVHPVGMAAAALAGHEVEGYDDSIATTPEFTAPLEQALETMPPVSSSYYYSLTGRLETIEAVVDVLSELARRKRDKSPFPTN